MAHVERHAEHYADHTSRDQGSTAFDYSDVESSIDTNPYHGQHYDEQELDRTLSYRRGDDAQGLNLKSYAARAGGPPRLAVDTSPQILDSTQSASSPLNSGIPRSGLRQGSVTHKSPLQKLEITLGDLSKEEKRVRAEEAEQRAIERQASRARPASNSQSKRAALVEAAPNGRPTAYLDPSQQSAQPWASPIATVRRSDTRPRGSGYNTLGAWERRFGYDAALSGAAATAAVGAYESAGKYYSESKPANQQGQGMQIATQRDLDVQSDQLAQPETARNTQSSDGLPPPPPALPQGNKPRKSVGFEEPDNSTPSLKPEETLAGGHRFPSLHRHETAAPRRYQRSPVLGDWKSAPAACLDAVDQSLEQEQVAWWEKNESEASRRKSSHRRQASAPPSAYGFAHDGRMEKTAFRPPVSLKCGPLLRYSGIRSDDAGRKYWRGSVMVVTDDENSSYSTIPTLRLFKQPMELARPPQPRHPEGNLQNLVYEPSDDPVAGLPKCSSTGETLYVKPVDMVQSNLDLSRVEGDEGLFERTAVPVNENAVLSRLSPKDGEKMAKFKEVEAFRLHAERGFTFWRFNIEVELTQEQSRIAYRINHGPSTGFWVPAADQSMHIMFHSCNGFSMSVDAASFCGPDPMWRDVLNQHQYRPFHVMIGGGDQIYNDAVTRQTEHFQEWLSIRNPEQKHNSPFTVELQEELESFYLDRYAMWFSQGLFGLANSQIPMVNVWDDHDIIDGFGSYPDHFMRSPVFSGIGGVAFKYYMLFQHQSIPDETEHTEPSWILGARPGPYIHELSRSLFMSLGNNVSLVGIDCRTERQRDSILSQESYDNIFDRCHHEIVKGDTKHLLVLLGVPIAYPRLNFLENILTSRMMDPIKALGRTGALGGFVNKFDGGVEILDDLDDHWTAKHHKRERNWFINELQELAASKSVRITILGGDVHLGAIGRFFSKAKLGIPKDRDHRYMPNVISSAIVNTPPPEVMADVLNKRNKIHHLDAETDEDMVPIFTHDVDGKSRNNQRLLPRRNWCSICEFDGISSPQSTAQVEPAPRPGFMRRFSVGANESPNAYSRPSGASKLLRRLSGRGGAISRGAALPGTPSQSQSIQDLDMDSTQAIDDSLPPGQRPRANSIAGDGRHLDGPFQTASFQRLPNNTNERSVKKDSTGRQGHIDLQHGLNITLNFEIDQRDPSGQTTQYSLIVPALSYDGPADVNSVAFRGTTRTVMSDLGRRFTRKRDAQSHVDAYDASPALNGNREVLERSEPEHDASHNAPATTAVGLGVAGIYHNSKEDAHLDNISGPEAPHDTWNDEYQQHMGANNSGWSPSSSGQKSKGLQEPDQNRATDALSPQHKDSASVSPVSVDPDARYSGNSASFTQSQPSRQKSLRAGPPAPKNIDQLPASVRNRYSQFADNREQPSSSPISNEGYATARNSFERNVPGAGAVADDARFKSTNGNLDQSPNDAKAHSPAAGRRLQKSRPSDSRDNENDLGIGRSPSLMQRMRNRLTPRQHNRTVSVDDSNRFAQDPQARHIPWLHEAAAGSFSTPNTMPRTSMSQSRQQQQQFGPLTSHSTGHDNALTAAHRGVIYSQHFGREQPNDDQWMGIDASPDISQTSVDRPPPKTKPSKFERLAGIDVLDQNDTMDTLGQGPRRAKTERAPQSRMNGQHPAENSQPSRPRPYSGPGAGRSAGGGRKSTGGLLPAPRPTGLGMSERAARQLGYEDGVPTLEEQGSWLERAQAKQRRDINRRSSDSGAQSSRRSSWRRWLE